MDKFTVRDSNGSVDVKASVGAYSKSLADWVSVNETPVDKIENAVESVFDSHSTRLPTQFLVSLAVQELGTPPDQFQSVSNRVAAYIKGQLASGRLDSTKGKGGGISRLARPGESVSDR
jgi:hypothetical protein